MATMTLYMTPTSPYARAIRIVLRHLDLSADVDEIHARTRTPQNETLDVNPTGKVPSLVVTDEGGASVVLSESRIICEYLERISGSYGLVAAPEHLQARAFEGVVTGFVDVVSVWTREMRRPPGDRSEDILQQERDRAQRCLQYLERAVETSNLPLPPTLNFATALLTTGLHVLDGLVSEPWERTSPALGRWQKAIESLAPVSSTLP